MVVTGAAGGLGQEFCKLLLGKGATVVAADLADIPADLGNNGVFKPTQLDVTDPAGCRELANDIQPDVWINNAGILGAGQVSEQDGESMAKVLSVNLGGVINGTMAAVSVMKPKGEGRILNVGSFASWTPAPGLAVYCATKHGVRAFTVATAAELASSGIKFSLLCPEGIWTPMLYESVKDGSAQMSFTARKLLMPAEVAQAGISLIERGLLIGSIPKGRAVLARTVGLSATAVVKMTPYLARAGKAGQRRMRDRLAGETGSVN